ncbi:hypothetical protein V6N13_136900 [Hibiscus sabdariffa]|uniref:Uncharacterized protein n=1 Tax=Hibiscus sabdariffa TaxID=183260 RepID=A0ABR2DNT9_9ROSI
MARCKVYTVMPLQEVSFEIIKVGYRQVILELDNQALVQILNDGEYLEINASSALRAEFGFKNKNLNLGKTGQKNSCMAYFARDLDRNIYTLFRNQQCSLEASFISCMS